MHIVQKLLIELSGDTMEKFLTFTEYINKNMNTPNEEDYIEMIYRLQDQKITNSLLSSKLNVKPSSITKMINKLICKKLILKECIGEIKLSEEGKKLGERCIRRHGIVENFLKNIGIKNNLLLHTEVIEHTIDDEITDRIDLLNDIFEKNLFLKDYFK